MIRLSALASVVVVLATTGQTPARDRAAEVPVGTGAIAGVVRDADAQPLRRASVTVMGDMRVERRVITGDDGRFEFDDLPAGRFSVAAEKPAYPSMTYGAKRPGRAGSGVLLADGQRVTNLVLTLARGAVLSGTVFDDRGQPMPEQNVMAYEVRTSLTGERVLDFPFTGGEWVTTDDRGQYRIYGLPPGEYTVGTYWAFHGLPSEARVPADAETRAAVQAASQSSSAVPGGPIGAPQPASPDAAHYNYSPVYYPDATDPMAAATVTVKSGEERDGIDLHMRLIALSRIEGTVVGPAGPVPNVGMVLDRRSRVTALNSATFWGTRPDGTFTTASLTPGDYTIMAATRPAAGEQPMWASSDVTIAGSDPINVTLVLQPAMTIAGRLVFESATLAAPKNLSAVRFILQGLGGRAMPNAARTTFDEAGGFSITGVTPGRFRFITSVPGAAAGQGGWSIKSVILDGQDVTDLPLEISAGRSPSMTVTFTDQSSELSGRLIVGAGDVASDYFIVLLPADRDYWVSGSRRIASARPDQAGNYLFRGLPPGQYRLAATTDLVPRDLQSVEALEQLAAQSTPVTLGFGEKKSFDLRIGGR